jgi:phospholipid/cholesterol/gamma-HCH transport system ATP-binding protein
MNLDSDVAVRFERVSKSFGTTCILDDVSFEVPRGTSLSIVGRRGAGKTVALKLAIGLLQPDRGRIFLNEEDITGLSVSDLLRVRKTTGFVFQDAAVFDSISVAENIAFALRYNSGRPESEIQERVHQHLLQVGLDRDKDKMPPDLSMGMRKLLGFARALAGEPAILLLDDPWNGLDCITCANLRTLLLDLKHHLHTTPLIFTCRLNQVQHISDQLAVLDAGRMIACGSPGEAAASGNPVVREFLSQEGF